MASPAPVIAPRRLIAPWYHTAIFLLIQAGITWWGAYVNRSGLAFFSQTQFGQTPIYAASIAGEWLIIYFIFAGVRHRGGLRGLIGGGWAGYKQAGVDFLIAAPFWLIATVTGRLVWRLTGPPHGPGNPLIFPPEGWLDISAWLALSATAGFCEEIMYRGYFQQQVRAVTGSATAAILAQATLFGLGHTYQGWKPVFVIAILGLLYGLLAHWRRNLRANMISHAWSDMFTGYFAFL